MHALLCPSLLRLRLRSPNLGLILLNHRLESSLQCLHVKRPSILQLPKWNGYYYLNQDLKEISVTVINVSTCSLKNWRHSPLQARGQRRLGERFHGSRSEVCL